MSLNLNYYITIMKEDESFYLQTVNDHFLWAFIIIVARCIIQNSTFLLFTFFWQPLLKHMRSIFNIILYHYDWNACYGITFNTET